MNCLRRIPERLRTATALAATLAAIPSVAGAQVSEPSVPYVPTPQVVVNRMLETAKVGPRDYLIDLGSGDGRIVITAAKRYGTRGFGVDLNPERILESNENARKAGVTDKVTFIQSDLFKTDLSPATVITMYLLPRVNMELRPRLLALAPGTRIVSHDFDMGDWKPDAHFAIETKEKYDDAGGTSDVFFWVVPARVAGVWHWTLTAGGKPQRYELRLDQRYQQISGGAWVAGAETKIVGARLRGADIRLGFTTSVNGAPVRHELTGKVEGDSINGTVSLSGARIQGRFEWSARRYQKASRAQPAPGGTVVTGAAL